MTDQTITQHEYEQKFAGAAFIGAEQVIDECGWLDPDIFTDQRISKYWNSVKSGTPPLDAALDAGIDQMDLIDWNLAAVSARHAKTYARQIAKQHYLSSVMQGLSKLARQVGDGDTEQVSSLLTNMAGWKQEAGTLTRTADIIGIDFIETVDEDHRTIPSGVPAYDNLIGYLEREMLNIWGGRPGMGKTSGAVQIARNVAEAGSKSLIFALEGSETSLWARMACAEVGVTWLDLKAGRLSEHQINEVKAASGRLAGVYHGNLIIDAEARSMDDIWRAISQNRPDVVVVDHIGHVDPMHENDIHSLGFISKECKQMAKRFDCHFILICQLNRSPDNRDDKRPAKKDLRGSGKIEQNADLITMMYRDDYYEDKEYWNYTAEWNVIKNRDGPTGRAHLSWQPEKLWFGGAT